MKTKTGRDFSIDLKNAHTLADFVNNASPECSPIDALHKCIDRLAEYAQPDIEISTSPPEPAFWIVKGRRGKRTWVLHPADSEADARAVANRLKDATITPMYTTPQPTLAVPTLSCFTSPLPAAPSAQPTKPAKTGRDLYMKHVVFLYPKRMPEWCELSDEDQADWVAKAKGAAKIESQARIHHASFGAGRVPPKADNTEMLATLGGGWIEWAGGGCPVSPDAKVDVRVSSGALILGELARYLLWAALPGRRVVAYRIAKEQS